MMLFERYLCVIFFFGGDITPRVRIIPMGDTLRRILMCHGITMELISDMNSS